MSSAEILTTQVDLTGLLKVLGENLYSTPSVVLRELVQNSHDSCIRRTLESKESFSPRISVTGDPQSGKLVIEDTGSGLTRDEIIQYLATIGSGYTRKLRDSVQTDSLIGYFGLGFLSSYVVSDRISVWTTSYQEPEKGWLFRSHTGQKYTLEETTVRPIGTQVTLQLKNRFRNLADPEILQTLLSRYCPLLTIPIYVDEQTQAVNEEPAPWRFAPGEKTELYLKKQKLAFASRFEDVFSPLCTIDVGKTGEQPSGILWVQDSGTYGSSDNRNISVFVRGMLISNDARDLLPRWAGFVGGVIESNLLTPTASREELMKDDEYQKTAHLLNEALIAGLGHIAKQDRVTWRRILLRHNESLLGASLCDDRLFDLLADELTIPTSEGDLTVPQIRAKGESRLLVSLHFQNGVEEILFRALKIPVALGVRYAVLPFLKRYGQKRGVSVVELGTKQGNQTFFPALSLAEPTQKWLETKLLRSRQKLMPTRFSPKELPLVLVPDRESELKKRLESDEADKRMSTAALGLARLYTQSIDGEIDAHLYLNLDSPVIKKLIHLQEASVKQSAASEVKSAQATTLLRLLAALLESSQGELKSSTFQETLQDYSDTLCQILEGNE